MRLQRINYAEAIIEPFYDGSDSDRPNNKIAQITHYDVKCSDPSAAKVGQIWCGARAELNAGAPVWIEMTRACSIDISDFDIFRVFCSSPKAVLMTIRAEIDGKWVTLCANDPGTDNTDEHSYALSGQKMTGLTIRLEQDGMKDCYTLLQWIGLSNAQREADMLAQKSAFPADWPDMLKEDGDFEPTIGIMFGKDEVDAIRRRVHEGALAPVYARMLDQAEEYLSWEPERDIGEFIGNPDRRWVRERDRSKQNTSAVMQTLAFVGLMERDPRMMKMAVRMALSAAHCTFWTESIMGALPGCAWHHRSFTEEVYCRGCAAVLDWAGSWLTSYGQMAIVDAIAMKGLPRLESDFKRQEYIRSMNQGIVFSSGRIFGLLACRHYFPRYESMILEAERDLNEMIDGYILPDGGSPEGPGYWNYTFSQAMPILYILARFHGKSFHETLTPKLEKTGLHALAQLSITGDGTVSIPVNDAHSGSYSPLLMAAFHALTGKEDYVQVMAASFRTGNVQPSLDLFIMSPDHLPEGEAYLQKGFTCLPDLGQARVIREDASIGRISLSFFTGLADVGHFHMDKGSFVLETEKEALLIDRGVLSYNHPDTAVVAMPEYHNLLYPELKSARARQKPTREGAYLLSASFENGVFEAAGDVTHAWDQDCILKNTRRIVSSSPREYVVEDEMLLSESAPVSFIVNTLHPCEAIGNGVIVHGKHSDVRIEADWTPAEIECRPFGIDEHEHEVWRVCLRAAPGMNHHLTTRILIC